MCFQHFVLELLLEFWSPGIFSKSSPWEQKETNPRYFNMANIVLLFPKGSALLKCQQQLSREKCSGDPSSVSNGQLSFTEDSYLSLSMLGWHLLYNRYLTFTAHFFSMGFSESTVLCQHLFCVLWKVVTWGGSHQKVQHNFWVTLFFWWYLEVHLLFLCN